MTWLESLILLPDAPPLARKMTLRELRRRWEKEPSGEMSDIDVKCETLSHVMKWGSFGKSGKEPIRVRYVCDLDTDHIENILIFCAAESEWRLVLLRLLRRRWQTEQKTTTV